MSNQQIVNGQKVDGRGGKREGAGRPVGAYGPYHKTGVQKLRLLAQNFTEEAPMKIVTVMRTTNSDTVALVAAGMILDRGHGKSREFVSVERDETLTVQYETLEQARAKLIEAGIPLDRLGQPKLIEHEPADLDALRLLLAMISSASHFSSAASASADSACSS